jgi:serine/threonine protein kinase
MDKGTLMPYEGLLLDYNQDGWGTIKLQTHLGGGAYGDVFHGVEEGTGKDVTVKIIRNVNSDMEEYRVKNECNIDLDSEHIVPVVSSQKWTDDTWVILFQYFKSEDLGKIIASETAFTVSDVRHYAAQMIKALYAAHSANIIHRDIKPANMLIDNHSPGSPGHLKVIDFGVSKLRTGESMTISDVPVGTIPYMCTTVYLRGGKDASFSADVFSFGVTIAEMLLGRHPWWEDYDSIGDIATAQKANGQEWIIPDADVPEGGKDIWDLARDCTYFDEAKRPRQWKDIASRLGLDLELEPIGARNFGGEAFLLNESGANTGGLILISLNDGDSAEFGRDKICYTNKRLSRKHIAFHREDDKLFVTDLGSKHGTWVDGEQLEPETPVEVQDGSRIRVEDVFVKIEFR